jgi:hypothetical protein
MWPKGVVANRIADHVDRTGGKLAVMEVRIGLGYIAVLLEGKRLGLAALLQADLPTNCTAVREAGGLAGEKASHLLNLLSAGQNPLEKALGLATANAILSVGQPADNQDAIGLMNLTPSDRVVMVGLFPPLIPKIQNSGAALTVIERNPARLAPVPPKAQQEALKECTVAIITATTLLNGTFENIINALTSLTTPRHVALLGPSTPLYPDAFTDTPVNHLGGAIARDRWKILRVVSEGGGTPAMRPYLDFINLLR